MSMKKIYTIGLMGLLFFGVSSCNDPLDTHPTDFFDEATVWSSFSTANAFVNGVYGAVLADSSNGEGTGMWAGNGSAVFWECRTPNSVWCSLVGEGTDGFPLETSINAYSNYGVNHSTGLRMCNVIIEKAAASQVMSEEQKKILVAEGKFLRAMTFFDQARKMGYFIPIKQVLSQNDTLAAKIPMTSSLVESYDIIVEDFEDAIADLPEFSSAGRANKYAAETMLSEACLQAYAYTKDTKYLDKAISAASDVVEHKALSPNYGDIFNIGNSTDPEILLGYYYLEEDTYVSNFCELIDVGPNIQVTDTEPSMCPIPFKNAHGGATFMGWAVFFPTQDLVDQYLVVDDATGKALPWWETSQWKDNVDDLDPASVTTPGQVDSYNRSTGEPRRIPSDQDFANLNAGYPTFQRYAALKSGRTDTRNISQLMYEKRDKRFYSSVVYDQCEWLGETMETNLQGNASAGVRDKENGGWYNTVTNYYWRKNVPEDLKSMFYATQTDYHFCIARTAMAYLNLAEAYLCKKNVVKAVEALNATRTIHGGLPASEASTLEEAWADYIREHNIEFCSEAGYTYFAYLRWGKYGGYANGGAPEGDVVKALDAPVHKIMISRGRDKVLVGQVTTLGASNRRFTTRRYLLPIAQNFLNTREAYGLDHQQNEGW